MAIPVVQVLSITISTCLKQLVEEAITFHRHALALQRHGHDTLLTVVALSLSTVL